MDNSASSDQNQYASPYQQQQMDSWKNTIKKFWINAWPYLYRGINEFLLVMMKVIRGSIKIAKEQLWTLRG